MNRKLEPIRRQARIIEAEIVRPYTFVMAEYAGIIGRGFAKCSPRDEWSPELGRQIAEGRAIRDIAQKLDVGGLEQEMRLTFGPTFGPAA